MDSNKNQKNDLLKDMLPKEGKDCKPSMPKQKRMGKNKDGYDILPGEGK